MPWAGSVLKNQMWVYLGILTGVLCFLHLFKTHLGASLGVQWLRLCASTVGGMGSVSDLGSKILHASR